jgi:arylsulfatase A-like enzyme
MMRRREFLGGIVASVGVAGVSPTLAVAPKSSQASAQGIRRPNFVFIYTDDQRYDAIRALGRQPWLRTPNMDRMVTRGGNFRNGFVTTSLCSPSRSSFLTGCYVHKTGVMNNDRTSLFRTDLPCVLPLLEQAGYATSYVGKIHIPNFQDALKGASHVATFPGQGSYNNQTFLVNGVQTPTQGYISDSITRFSMEFMRNRDKSKPFAMFVGHKAVHGPFQPDAKYAKAFDNEYMPLPPTWDDPYEGKPSYLAARRKTWHGLEGLLGRFNYSAWQREIAACLVSVDDSIGQIFKELEATGQLDDTIVIFASDNGYFQGQHGLNDKRAMYEDSIRIPHLVHYPRLIKPGTVFDQMVLNLDLAPTMLDFARAEIPRTMQGRSWRPVLEGRDPQGRESWMYEYFWEKPYPWDPTQYGIRSRRYKYIRYPDVGSTDPDYPMKPPELPAEELYDLQNDPLEMKNLARDPAASAALNQMRDALKKTVDDTQYPGGYR